MRLERHDQEEAPTILAVSHMHCEGAPVGCFRVQCEQKILTEQKCSSQRCLGNTSSGMAHLLRDFVVSVIKRTTLLDMICVNAHECMCLRVPLLCLFG